MEDVRKNREGKGGRKGWVRINAWRLQRCERMREETGQVRDRERGIMKYWEGRKSVWVEKMDLERVIGSEEDMERGQ